MKHTLGWCTDDGKVTIDYRPVHYHTLDASEQVRTQPPLLKKLSRLGLRKRLRVADFARVHPPQETFSPRFAQAVASC